MSNFTVHKAGSVGGRFIHSVDISISREMPDFQSLTDTEQIFDNDAETVVEVLCGSLPQGTLDRVLAKLMTRKVSSFVGVLSE